MRLYVAPDGSTHESLRKLKGEYGVLMSDYDGSESEQAFIRLLLMYGHPITAGMYRQWHFTRKRLYAFDFAWPAHKVCVEIEGGVYSRGAAAKGHGGAKFVLDCEKYNLATAMGWAVLRLGPNHVSENEVGRFLAQLGNLKEVLRGRGFPQE